VSDYTYVDLSWEYALRLGLVRWRDPHRGPVRIKVGTVLAQRERMQAMENLRHWPADVALWEHASPPAPAATPPPPDDPPPGSHGHRGWP
jgi:hypothetical protein